MVTGKKIGVIGLGYVGLPLAVEFAKKYSVVGFDINKKRISELLNGVDNTFEINEEALIAVKKEHISDAASTGIFFSDNIEDIRNCNIYIITVPTPTDKNNRPDLTPLYKASATVGNVLQKGDIVIYESTVYPGVTEDECVPVLEKVSNLKFNEDFFVGYSPERINPGDKEHTVSKILKVTSGSTPFIADVVDGLYQSVIIAGTHKAPSIKVAEAAKVIENSQRDINIAFVNELSKIFNLLGIDTDDVLRAAGTKWNFLKFKPGLVGGHCIGVDPYYLAQKAQEVGYHPEIILAGRRINDGMGEYIAHELIKLMIKKDISIRNSKVLILGITFKENCPDVRNTKVIDIIKVLKTYEINITVVDPWANSDEVLHEYGIDCINKLDTITDKFNAIVLAVSHNEFLDIDYDLIVEDKNVFYDVKSVMDRKKVDARL
ncbi:MAG: nucleotide sugar dehydrogenase [Bacteroidota bacterium]